MNRLSKVHIDILQGKIQIIHLLNMKVLPKILNSLNFRYRDMSLI